MIRVVHAQTVLGAILVDDIDDGLPNKDYNRLGSSGDPKVYKRDGYANADKQRCYVPRRKIGETAIPGYIDLRETQKVKLSAGKGKIAKLLSAGLVTVVSLQPSDLVTPNVTAAVAASQITAAQITLDFILDERSREMYEEGTRWQDLARTQTLGARIRAYNTEAATGFKDDYILRPIPANEIQLITQGPPFPQNPGY